VTKYLTPDQVIAIHDELLEKFGGLRGVRDHNLLCSALDAPKASFGGTEVYATMHEKAAAYMYHLARNHPFNDGNKRTSYVVTLVFLKMNHVPLRFKIERLEQIVIDVAHGKMDKTALSQFFKGDSVKRSS
jgi:death-on-curing protein